MGRNVGGILKKEREKMGFLSQLSTIQVCFKATISGLCDKTLSICQSHAATKDKDKDDCKESTDLMLEKDAKQLQSILGCLHFLT